jgi:hypothetical protein
MPWAESEYLLAGVVDTVNQNSAVTIAAAGGKYKKPELFPRPGEDKKNKIGNRGTLSSLDAVKRLRVLLEPTPEQAEALAKIHVREE